MHSMRKLFRNYPQILAPDIPGVHVNFALLSAFYGQLNGSLPTWAANNRTFREYLQQIDVPEFLRKTNSDVEIFGCRFGKYDCKNDWTTKRTLYGSCKEIVPKRFRDDYGNEITAQSLSLLMTYNLTDWVSGGWAHYLEGYTIYYSHPDDNAFSPTNGILVADITRGVPIVSMFEKRTHLIGGQYSKCVAHDELRKLHYFDTYTKEQCRQDCMLLEVQEQCGCWPAFLPPKHNHVKICDFIEHAECVAPLLANFEYSKFCNCAPKCEESESFCDSIQYGKYHGTRSGQIKKDKMLTSIMLYVKPEQRVFRTEQVEYDMTQFFSDVGGAAGLLLGISLTSLFGMLDAIFWIIVGFLVKNRRRIKRKINNEKKIQFKDRSISCTGEEFEALEKTSPVANSCYFQVSSITPETGKKMNQKDHLPVDNYYFHQ